MSNNLNVINFCGVDCSSFIKEDYSNKDYIKFELPSKLIELFNKSGLHSAIVSGMVDLIVGKEYVSSDESNIELKQFISHPNNSDSLKDLINKITFDYYLQGGSYIELVKSKHGNYIAQVNHLPYDNIRISTEGGQKTGYFYSNDFSKYKPNKTFIPEWSFTNPPARGIIYIKQYRPGLKFYGTPSYVGGLNWIELDGRISNFHLNGIKNGLAPSMFIEFNNGTPTMDEQRVIRRKIENDLMGDENTGRFILNFNDSKETSSTITPISVTDIDKQYVTIADQVLQNIIAIHKINPELISIMIPGKLGNSSDLYKQFSVLQQMVIFPFQEKILKPFNDILEFNKINNTLEVVQLEPVNFQFSENILSNILTQNELREMIKKEPIQ